MANILVVEGEQQVTWLLKMKLETEGYQIVTVLNDEDAVQYTLRETPHLINLDISLIGSGGYEIVRKVRNHPKTMHIPIIILGARDELADRVYAFDLGVDDYILKPYHDDELLARIRTQLRRVRQTFLSPLVGLPGGLQVEMAIQHQLNSHEPWSMLYLDLDNFKAFNDVYGFLAGNDLIRLVGRICQYVVHEYGNTSDFVGHVGGDDFVIVTTPDRANTLCLQIIDLYKEKSMAFYHPEDLERGSISAVDRKGRPYQSPLVSLSIGVVNNQMQRPHSIQEVSYLAAAAKYHAKQSTDNIYYVSSLRDNTRHEVLRSSHATYPLSSPFMPPSLSIFTSGYAYYDPLLYMEEDGFTGYEQKVH